MDNHVHLVATPGRADSLARALRPVHLRYAQHVNWTQGLSGRLWQGRFFSCPLDEGHFWMAVRYVEQNPLRAGLVQRAEDYAWSSAGAHCGRRQDALLHDALWLAQQVEDWAAWLVERDDAEETAALRLHTRTGRPFGGEEFVDRLERESARRLRPGKGGRPRKPE
jgi:putative transposase